MYLEKATQALSRVIYPLSRTMNRIGGGVLAVMMFLTATDVVLRYVFNRPITSAYELTEMMLSIVIIFGLAYVTLRKEHIRIDFIISRFSPRTQAITSCTATLLGLAIIVLITWQIFEYGVYLRNGGDTTAILKIPIFISAWIAALGMAIFAAASLVEFLEHLTKLVVNVRSWVSASLISLVILISLVFCLPLMGNILFKLTPLIAGTVAVSVLIILIFAGMNIGLAMALIGFLGMSYINSLNAGLTTVGTSPFTTVSSDGFSVIPLFMLMGIFCFHSGLIRDLYLTMHKWLGHLPGGLAMATVAGCAGFAAVCGSSTATVATLGMVALPEMRRYKYDARLATGVIAAGGSIGSMIPPSIILILYGILTEQSIGRLFLAGFIPGVTEAIFYMITILILCKTNPMIGPRGEKVSFTEKLVSLKGTWGVLVLFILVLGGIYTGVFTPTEAAGVGAFGAFLFALGRRKLGWRVFGNSLTDTTKNTAMCFVILIGALIFNYLLAVSRLPFELATFAAGLEVNRFLILGIIMVITLILGCFMSGMAIIMLTIPIFFPVIMALDFNPIWFGILVTRMTEIGVITPPIGINVFVMYGVAKDIPMGTIFRGIVPFLIADFFHIAMLVAFPQISLFLPNLMK